MFCLSCENQELEVKQDAVIEQEFRGETLQVHTPAMACPKCHWTAVALEQLDEMRRRTADAYREKHALLTSKQIRDCRNRLKMSQAEFAAFLGVGVASVKRWETWQVQDRVYDDRIRSKCLEALAQQDQNEVCLWFCVTCHVSTKASNGVTVQANPPQRVMSSRWDWSPGTLSQTQNTTQPVLPPFGQPAASGLSPPDPTLDAFSLSAP